MADPAAPDAFPRSPQPISEPSRHSGENRHGGESILNVTRLFRTLGPCETTGYPSGAPSAGRRASEGELKFRQLLLLNLKCDESHTLL